jgi:hypothetical protein
MALTDVSRIIAEMQQLRAAVEIYERLTRNEVQLLRERVANCLTVTREISHRLLVLEGQQRGE